MGSNETVTHPCRWCGAQVYTVQKWGTAKWLVLLAGLLLAPVCVGLLLVPVALCMGNEQFVACDTCGRQ